MRLELLSPAGDYECFLAAINNGADAVYLAGPKFGARAYAGNFSMEEIKRAARVAHLFGSRIHLTVNTLVKEEEIDELREYVSDAVSAGVDAFIIQDMGAAKIIHEMFPDVCLHASTQMTVTGPKGANLLKNIGFSRVILPRELSLEEIKAFSKNTDIEIEAFIHGAMCYGLSGQCLFSSCLGERSANRGRCAGPCRLPYSLGKDKKSKYLLSLKDMMAIDVIPKLIDAGVTSFKIEGRMKPPAYVAAATGIYRKYIDVCVDNPGEKYKVFEHDRKILEQIYHRGFTRDGYFTKPSGKDMITLNSPAYEKSEESIIAEVENTYLSKRKTIPLKMKVNARLEKPIILTLTSGDYSATVTGARLEKAKSSPVSKDKIRKQLEKLGDTIFTLDDIEIKAEGNIFLPVSLLNEIRRKGVEALEEEILSHIS